MTLRGVKLIIRPLQNDRYSLKWEGVITHWKGKEALKRALGDLVDLHLD